MMNFDDIKTHIPWNLNLTDAIDVPFSLLAVSKKAGSITTCSEFSPDGWLLAIGDAKGVITIWLKRGELGWAVLTKLQGHEGEISCLRFNERIGDKQEWTLLSSSHDRPEQRKAPSFVHIKYSMKCVRLNISYG